MIELLEQRRLLSIAGVLADVKAVETQGATLRAGIAAANREAGSELSTVELDLQRVGTQSARKSAAALRRSGTLAIAKLSAITTRDLAMVNSDAVGLALAYLKAARFPTNSRFAAALATERTKLSAAATAAVSAIDADTSNLVTTITNDLNSIASTTTNNSKIQTDIATAETALTSNAQQADNQAASVSTAASAILSATQAPAAAVG
jgi:hypothetical protein